MPKPKSAHQARPFLKWAGGKTQLLPLIDSFLPVEFQQEKIRSYVEPFLGGGAVFFYLQAKLAKQLKSIFLSDANTDLISAYCCVRDDCESLISSLKNISKEYYALSPSAQSEFYYELRELFNQKMPSTSSLIKSSIKKKLSQTKIHQSNLEVPKATQVDRVSQLLTLNKLCYNGLFRVNSRGLFNVPFGSYTKPAIVDEENLRLCCAALQGVEIAQGDFTVWEKKINKSAFVYMDPPYRPLTKTASFNSYSNLSFSDREQKRLADWFTSLHKKGAKLMLSNSDPKNIDSKDHFFEDIFSNFKKTIYRIPASRFINSVASKRGTINELLITNYSKSAKK